MCASVIGRPGNGAPDDAARAPDNPTEAAAWLSRNAVDCLPEGALAEKLKRAGYVVRFEEFEFPYFEDRTPPVLATVGAPEAETGRVHTLTNSGSADVAAPLRAVNLALTDTPAASTSGCDAHDFDGFTGGAIALVRRGTCTFQVKAENAIAACALGATSISNCMSPATSSPPSRPSGTRWSTRSTGSTPIT